MQHRVDTGTYIRRESLRYVTLVIKLLSIPPANGVKKLSPGDDDTWRDRSWCPARWPVQYTTGHARSKAQHSGPALSLSHMQTVKVSRRQRLATYLLLSLLSSQYERRHRLQSIEDTLVISRTFPSSTCVAASRRFNNSDESRSRVISKMISIPLRRLACVFQIRGLVLKGFSNHPTSG